VAAGAWELRDEVSGTETAAARAGVVETARAMVARGLVAAAMGNVSVRVGDQVHITPSGMRYRAMGPADLVTLGLDARVLAGEHRPSVEHPIHLAVYAARPDVRAIVHAHGVHAMAWGCLRQPLDTGVEELEAVGGAVGVAPYAAPGSPELAAGVVAALGSRGAVLMARHGALGVGRELEDALDVCEIVERQAHVALLLAAARNGV
jgi:L-fuculose-phosphate aldolase